MGSKRVGGYILLLRTYRADGSMVELEVERFIVRTHEEALERLMTQNQMSVYIAIDEFWKKYGFGPTVENIQFMTGDRSRSNIHRIMRRLVELGVCKQTPRRARSIRPSYIKLYKVDMPD